MILYIDIHAYTKRGHRITARRNDKPVRKGRCRYGPCQSMFAAATADKKDIHCRIHCRSEYCLGDLVARMRVKRRTGFRQAKPFAPLAIWHKIGV